MKFKKISIGLIALWFLFLTAATFWSVKEESKNLPSVWTEEAQEGSIEYEFPVDLEVSAADQAIGYISAYDNVPESLLQEGCIYLAMPCIISYPYPLHSPFSSCM